MENKNKYFSENTALFISGALTGIIKHTILFPIDTIKTRSQLGIYKYTSFRSLYTGIPLIYISVIPYYGTYYLTYTQTKKILNNYNIDDTLKWSISACVAHLSSIINIPFDVIKQRWQVDSSKFDSISKFKESLKNIYNTQGVSSLFRSLPVKITMGVPIMLTDVLIYENILKHIKKDEKDNDLIDHFIAGFVSGGVSGFITNPLDVIKSNVQVYNILILDAIKKQTLKSIWYGSVYRMFYLSCSSSMSWFLFNGINKSILNY